MTQPLKIWYRPQQNHAQEMGISEQRICDLRMWFWTTNYGRPAKMSSAGEGMWCSRPCWIQRQCQRLCSTLGETWHLVCSWTRQEEDDEVNYLGRIDSMFKQRFDNYNKWFNYKRYEKDTEFSKYTWQPKDNNIAYDLKWIFASRCSQHICDLTFDAAYFIFTHCFLG